MPEVKPAQCTFCQKCPPTKRYSFTSLNTLNDVFIWICDCCYEKTQEAKKAK